MKKKEVEELISDESRNEELKPIIDEHLRRINEACNVRHCEFWGYSVSNPFEHDDRILNAYYDDECGKIIAEYGKSIETILYIIYIKPKDLYDFDYCKYAKKRLNEEIEYQKKKIIEYQKGIQKASDKIKEKRRHLKGEC